MNTKKIIQIFKFSMTLVIIPILFIFFDIGSYRSLPPWYLYSALMIIVSLFVGAIIGYLYYNKKINNKIKSGIISIILFLFIMYFSFELNKLFELFFKFVDFILAGYLWKVSYLIGFVYILFTLIIVALIGIIMTWWFNELNKETDDEKKERKK